MKTVNELLVKTKIRACFENGLIPSKASTFMIKIGFNENNRTPFKRTKCLFAPKI